MQDSPDREQCVSELMLGMTLELTPELQRSETWRRVQLAAAAAARTVLDLVANGLCIEVGVIEEGIANNERRGLQRPAKSHSAASGSSPLLTMLHELLVKAREKNESRTASCPRSPVVVPKSCHTQNLRRQREFVCGYHEIYFRLFAVTRANLPIYFFAFHTGDSYRINYRRSGDIVVDRFFPKKAHAVWK